MKTRIRQFFTNHPPPMFAALFIVTFGSIALIYALCLIGIGFVGTAYLDPTGEGTAQLISELAEHNITENWFLNVFTLARYWILGIAVSCLTMSVWATLHIKLNEGLGAFLERRKIKACLDELHKREIDGYCCGGATFSPNILTEIQDRIDSGEFDEGKR